MNNFDTCSIFQRTANSKQRSKNKKFQKRKTWICHTSNVPISTYERWPLNIETLNYSKLSTRSNLLFCFLFISFFFVFSLFQTKLWSKWKENSKKTKQKPFLPFFFSSLRIHSYAAQTNVCWNWKKKRKKK